MTLREWNARFSEVLKRSMAPIPGSETERLHKAGKYKYKVYKTAWFRPLRDDEKVGGNDEKESV